MGLYEERQDAETRQDHKQAFHLSLGILNRKGSKGLMVLEVGHCLSALEGMDKLSILPEGFSRLSCYGQREELNKLVIN